MVGEEQAEAADFFGMTNEGIEAELAEFKEVVLKWSVKMGDFIGWDIYRSKPGWTLVDAAESSMREMFPALLNTMSVNSDLQLVGELDRFDDLRFVVSVWFLIEEDL
jgi:hypothetical protein